MNSQDSTNFKGAYGTFEIAEKKEAFEISHLVNLSYRGDSSRQGWTTEADLLGGQRIDYDGVIELIEKSGSCIIIFRAPEKQEILACANVQIKPEYAYFGMITVSPDQQSKGLGSLLLKECETHAQKWGLHKIQMSVIGQRSELISWYIKKGFYKTNIKKPFPYGDARFGLPKRNDLYFEVLEKLI